MTVFQGFPSGRGAGKLNLARVCKTGFGMTVLGMTRTPREIPHVDRAFGKSGLLSVLPEADFVVLCLPHTPETRHIISGAKTCVDLRRTSRCWEWWTGGPATETTGAHSITIYRLQCRRRRLSGGGRDSF